jgi:5,6,7,8-tetrahydromethanopterin hydro-lyase
MDADAARLDGRLGSAASGVGVTKVHAHVSIASRGSHTAATITGALTQPSLRFAPTIVTVGAGHQIRPTTVLVPHTPIGTPRLTLLTNGVVRLGTAAGLLDAVADGLLPRHLADELVVMAAVTIDPELENQPVDAAIESSVESATRQAVAAALRVAVSATPSLTFDEMVASRNDLGSIR